ncbi:hypothetical protein A2858_03235, partial [Candidatus Daviesbacteria bacterium RIFCSPHIGHO2_01_FULL_36_37]
MRFSLSCLILLSLIFATIMPQSISAQAEGDTYSDSYSDSGYSEDGYSDSSGINYGDTAPGPGYGDDGYSDDGGFVYGDAGYGDNGAGYGDNGAGYGDNGGNPPNCGTPGNITFNSVPQGTITPGNYTMDWYDATNATSYRFELDKDYGSTPFYNNPCNNNTQNGDTCAYTSSSDWFNSTQFEAGKTYRIGVAGVNACGTQGNMTSVVANVINNTPNASLTIDPSSITGVSNVTISWSTSNIPSGATCSNNWNAFLTITPNTSGSDVRSMNQPYTFTISCSNGTQASANLSFTPIAPTFTQAYGACPAGGENAYAYLAWNSVSGATGYELVRDGSPPASFGAYAYYSQIDYAPVDSGGTYLYYVRAYTATTSSSWSYIYVNTPDCLTPAAYSINTPISSCLGINSPNLAVGINSSAHANNYSLYHQRVGYDSTWVNPNPTSGSLSIPAFSGVYNFNDATDLT